MKTIVIFFVCASMASCLLLETKADCISRDGTQEVVPTGTEVDENCALFTCNENGDWVGKACSEYRCRKQVGWREQDNSKPYPECCPGPICE